MNRLSNPTQELPRELGSEPDVSNPTDERSRAKQTPDISNIQLPFNLSHINNNTTIMPARIPSALRSAAFARPATTFAHTAALQQQSRRSFQTSQRMLQDVAPVRKPVGAFRGT